MVSEYSEYILFVVSLIASGFFSGSEAALISISVDRTRQIIKQGGKRGKAMEFLAKKPNRVLTTILIGNNLANILAASITTDITLRHFENQAMAISVGFTTILVLLVGEIIPKTFARTHAEKLSYPIIKILQVSYILMYPVVELFTWIIVKVLGKNAHPRGRTITQDDIEYMLGQAEKGKSIDSKQINLLTSILEFPKIKVKDIMVPRNKVNYITSSLNYSEVIKQIKKTVHSRYPVTSGEHLDEVIGFFHVKDLVQIDFNEISNFDVMNYVKEPFFVYEHMRIQSVFDHMNRRKVHLALVKDENNLVVGIVTLEDILEEIFGEIHDEHDEEIANKVQVHDRKKSGLIVSGDITLRDLSNQYNIEIPLNDNYSTLSGFLMDLIGNNFPEKGHIIFWEGYSFEILTVDKLAIKEVKIEDVEGERHLYSQDGSTKDGQQVSSVPSGSHDDKVNETKNYKVS